MSDLPKPAGSFRFLAPWVAVVVLLFAGAASLGAQSKRDSLLRIWQDTRLPDTVRLKAVQSVTWGLLNQYPDSAYAMANRQMQFARATGWKLWEAKALYSIGTYYYGKGAFGQSFSFFQKSLDLRFEINDLKGVAAIYGNFGLIFQQHGDNLKALDYQLKSLDLNIKIRDTLGICANYNNLATIYHEQENSAKALEYYEKSIALYDPVKNKGDIALVYNNIGSVYSGDDQYAQALDYFFRSLAVRTELNDRVGMSINLINIGSVYAKMADYDKAADYLQQSIVLFKELGDQSGITHAYYLLGDMARLQGNFNKAVKWCGASLDIARQLNVVMMQRNSCNCLYEAYKSMGNPTKALEYHEDYKMLNDSLKQGETELKLNQLQFEKDILTDSLAREEEKLNLKVAYQVELNKKNRTRNVILVLGVVVLGLAILFLSGMLYFRKNSAQFQLKAEQLEKQQLLNEIALLKTQVNPHFLFNSLSILSSLVHVNADLSEKFIDQLSRSYRYILEQKDQSLVTLRTELEFIRSYAFLLKIRFENKFDLQIHLPEALLDRFKIAPLTLQLLVENAVKHNRMSVREPLIIEVLEDDGVLVVRNRLQLRSQSDSSTGIGLQNIINRYALLTKRPVWAGEREEEFVVKVPLLE